MCWICIGKHSSAITCPLNLVEILVSLTIFFFTGDSLHAWYYDEGCSSKYKPETCECHTCAGLMLKNVNSTQHDLLQFSIYLQLLACKKMASKEILQTAYLRSQYHSIYMNSYGAIEDMKYSDSLKGSFSLVSGPDKARCTIISCNYVRLDVFFPPFSRFLDCSLYVTAAASIRYADLLNQDSIGMTV